MGVIIYPQVILIAILFSVALESISVEQAAVLELLQILKVLLKRFWIVLSLIN